jgi:hypothetical protein
MTQKKRKTTTAMMMTHDEGVGEEVMSRREMHFPS